MTQLNLKVRAKNPQFWISVALALGAPLFAYYGISGAELTTWGSVWKLGTDALSNPYVLTLMGASLYGALNDPTTKGFGDSQRAMSYHKPGGGR
ncbi:phage holin [Lysinibacillus xylanilyticus]|uniref:phage holin n=1 Tax=Lysinibacillus xylanilyticus TaxID=582475 RepID=UPI003CFF4843